MNIITAITKLNVVSTLQNIHTITGSTVFGTVIFLSLTGILSILTQVFTLLFKPKENKPRVSDLQKIQTAVLKNHSTVEGLTLLVGALSQKVETLTSTIDDIEAEMDDDVKRDVISISNSLETIHSEIEKERKINMDRASKIQENFQNIEKLLDTFIYEEYENFTTETKSQLESLHDAIFVPLNRDSEDSEYQEN
jgi:mannose/fructose/N-acetylgalactosamine-specific phosphotransferase system component IID